MLGSSLLFVFYIIDKYNFNQCKHLNLKQQLKMKIFNQVPSWSQQMLLPIQRGCKESISRWSWRLSDSCLWLTCPPIIPTHYYLQGKISPVYTTQSFGFFQTFGRSTKCIILFCQDDLRKELEIDSNLPAVLLMGGGEGMGPVQKTAQALGDSLYDSKERKTIGQLIVICGRNKTLASALASHEWKIPIKVVYKM